MSSQLPTYKEIHTHILTKAAKDDGFRQALLTAPKATVAKELAATFPQMGPIPAHLKINVVEQTHDAITVLLPAKPAKEADELSDAELESVAGGDDYPSVTCSDTCQWSLGDIC